jgi:hypothetical protein
MAKPPLESVLWSAYNDIRQFAFTEPFVSVLGEFWATPESERPTFVSRVLLNRDELRKRGVTLPNDMLIQRTAFRDNRPTQFAIVKHLPHGYSWEKVTITFDNTTGEPPIRYDDVVNDPVTRKPTDSPRSAPG